MGSKLLDKIAKMKERRPANTGGSRMSGIFHEYSDADNIVRLVGDFIEVYTHFLAPVPKRKDKGICMEDAFNGDDRISKVVNCLDWDMSKEEKKEKKTCPICKINQISYKIMDELADAAGGKDKLENEGNEELKREYDKYKALASSARARMSLKWNIIDRDNPLVKLVSEGGSEEMVLGFKIVTIGAEAWNDVEGIFGQCGIDITDPVDGIDICIKKGHNGTRVSYSANAVIEDGSVKTTPFTDEEKALQEHNILAICGKQTDALLILNGLHGEYRELLDLNLEEEPEESAPTKTEAPAKKTEAPAKKTEASAKKTEEETKTGAPKKTEVKEEPVEVDDVGSDDEDFDFLDDGESEKKN